MSNNLNLIRPEESNIRYKIIKFPDGEPHLVFEEELDRKDPINITCRICNSTDLFILMQIGDILQRHEITIRTLDIKYLMSSRIDRVISFNESYSLKIVSKIINSLKAKHVFLTEAHSDKTELLINNCINHTQSFDKYLPKEYAPVAPDKGAAKRRHFKTLCLFCTKERDLNTGKLSNFKIQNPEILKIEKSDHFVVIDDLCDGGGTFVGIAKELRKLDSKRKLSIYVTHMVNPKGIQTLSENYDEVYFTNSYKDWQKLSLPSNVTVIEIV